MKPPWPASLAIREGWETARASRGLGAITVLAAMLVATTIGLSNAVDVSRLAAAEQRWIDAGGYVYVVEPGPAEGSRLDVADCDRLSNVEGIEGSFAVLSTDVAAAPAHAPSESASLARVSPGIYSFFGLSTAANPSIIAGPGVVERTSLMSGESTVLEVRTFDGSHVLRSEQVTVSTVDSPILAESIAGSYLTADLLKGSAEQCYVSTTAPHAETVQAYIAAVLADGGPVVVRPRLSQDSLGLDFSTAYEQRPLRWAWAPGALVLLATWGLTRYARRTQTAIYATFGVTRRPRLLMTMTEWVLVTGVGTAWGWGVAMAFAVALDADPGIALQQISLQSLAAWSVSGIGTVSLALLPVGNLLEVLKDRS